MSVEIGNKYGSWTVIGATSRLVGVAKHKAWICQCDCERKTKRVVTEHSLIYNGSRSCGKCPNKGYRTWNRAGAPST
jgi:hypothetical protein